MPRHNKICEVTDLPNPTWPNPSLYPTLCPPTLFDSIPTTVDYSLLLKNAKSTATPRDLLSFFPLPGMQTSAWTSTWLTPSPLPDPSHCHLLYESFPAHPHPSIPRPCFSLIIVFIPAYTALHSIILHYIKLHMKSYNLHNYKDLGIFFPLLYPQDPTYSRYSISI